MLLFIAVSVLDIILSNAPRVSDLSIFPPYSVMDVALESLILFFALPAKLLHADGSLEELTLYLKNTSAEERELLVRGCLMNHYAAQRRE